MGIAILTKQIWSVGLKVFANIILEW